MRKTKEAKRKEARVEIVLPDGTHIVARGPMAEVMARRLTDGAIPWTWSRWPAWYTSNSATPAVYGCTTISSVEGQLENATVAQVGAAIDKGLQS